MDHLLAGTEIRLTYLQDRRALAAIDWPTVFDDLIDLGAPPNRCLWCDLDRLTHVILATDRATGHYAGMLGLVESGSGPEPYLTIEATMTRPGAAGEALALAMLAHALARVVSLDGKPAAIAATRGDHVIGLALRVLGSHIAAESYPPAEGNLYVLSTASLARRVSPGGIVLDLRSAKETSLLRDLRRLHHVKPERKAPERKANMPLMPKPARTGGATRHPRKATHTGRTG